MRAYVINLARSPDRRAHMIPELEKAHLDYEIIEAVDGRELDISDSTLVDQGAVADGSLGGRAAAGSVGCALSHLRVYRKVLEAGFERALVLEDDVVLPRDLADLAEAVGRHMSGAQVVLLNFHCVDPPRVTKTGAATLPSSRLLVSVVDLHELKTDPTTKMVHGLSSAGAYVITREACQAFERSSLPVRRTCDNWGLFVAQGTLDSVRCVVPMPVINIAKFRTTIDFFRPGSLQADMREWVARTKVPILYQAVVYRRQRNLRRAGYGGDVQFVESR